MTMKASTILKPDTGANTLSRDPEKLTHIVNPELNQHIRMWHLMSSASLVKYARQLRIPIVSLCGKKWVPDDDPEKYDACGTCINIAGRLMREAGQ